MLAHLKIRSVRSKLLAASLVMGLVPVTVVGVVAYRRASQSLVTDAGDALAQVAFQVADKIDRNYFERYGDVQAFSLASSRIRNWSQIGTLADEYMVVYGFYDLMVIADRSGRIVVVNSVDHTGKPLNTGFLTGEDVSGEDWFRQGMSGAIKPGETLTEDVHRNAWVSRLYGDAEQVTTFTAPIRDASGGIIGVWRNYASQQRIAETIMAEARTSYKQASGGNILFTLIKQDGTLLHDDVDEAGALETNLLKQGWSGAAEAVQHKVGWTPHHDASADIDYIAGYGASPQQYLPKFGWGTLVRVREEEALAPARALRNAVVAIAVFAAVALAVFATWFSGKIAKPIAVTAHVMREVSHDGDLTKRLHVTTRDELGDLAESFNAFLSRLAEIAVGIRGSSGNVAIASRELASVADNISSAAQTQASSLEETAASMEEITATVKQNAENAGQASRLAIAAHEVADKGGRVVGDAVTAMSEINESSRKINEIITTIDEIAFQTNLLALNAAVEAARAGAQGRGFAVVAAEVRSLAARSASAAKEIKGLIKESSAKVDLGSALVNESGQSLREIVSSVKRVTDIVAEIAAASREQTVGIEEVNRAVLQMDQVTQQNAAQNEELSATAGTLSQQARELDSMVSWFRLDGETQPPTSVLAVRPSAPSSGVLRRNAALSQPGVKRAATVTTSADGDDGFVDF
ncbi:MAG: methyl-accepting chemotaxis protein [Gemmatimonadaceae bacterium]